MTSARAVLMPRFAQPAPKPFNHVGREIDPQHVGAGRRRKHGQNPGTGADIDDTVSRARLHLRQHLFREQASIGIRTLSHSRARPRPSPAAFDRTISLTWRGKPNGEADTSARTGYIRLPGCNSLATASLGAGQSALPCAEPRRMHPRRSHLCLKQSSCADVVRFLPFKFCPLAPQTAYGHQSNTSSNGQLLGDISRLRDFRSSGVRVRSRVRRCPRTSTFDVAGAM